MSPTRLTIHAILDSSTGYGQMTGHLAKQLESTGIPVGFRSIYRQENLWPLDAWVGDRLETEPAEPSAPSIVMGAPWTIPPAGSIMLTMWEATRLPPAYIEGLNRAACLVVPCEANRRWFQSSGVEVPIHVVPLGIDPQVHHPGAGTQSAGGDDGVVRFGASGRNAGRKGLFAVLMAWMWAFRDVDAGVGLEVKVWEDCQIPEPDDPRIVIRREAMTDRQLADWYRSLDVFVSASKGEGWGLQPHQALACGVPVIAPRWGGHADYLAPDSSWPVDYTERPSRGTYEAPGACWCDPHHGSLSRALRLAFDDGEGRRAKAEAAGVRGREFTWERSGQALAQIVRSVGLWRD